VRRPRDLQVKLQIALAEAHSEEAVQDVQKLRKAVDGEVVRLDSPPKLEKNVKHDDQ